MDLATERFIALASHPSLPYSLLLSHFTSCHSTILPNLLHSSSFGSSPLESSPSFSKRRRLSVPPNSPIVSLSNLPPKPQRLILATFHDVLRASSYKSPLALQILQLISLILHHHDQSGLPLDVWVLRISYILAADVLNHHHATTPTTELGTDELLLQCKDVLTHERVAECFEWHGTSLLSVTGAPADASAADASGGENPADAKSTNPPLAPSDEESQWLASLGIPNQLSPPPTSQPSVTPPTNATQGTAPPPIPLAQLSEISTLHTTLSSIGANPPASTSATLASSLSTLLTTLLPSHGPAVISTIASHLPSHLPSPLLATLTDTFVTMTTPSHALTSYLESFIKPCLEEMTTPGKDTEKARGGRHQREGTATLERGPPIRFLLSSVHSTPCPVANQLCCTPASRGLVASLSTPVVAPGIASLFISLLSTHRGAQQCEIVARMTKAKLLSPPVITKVMEGVVKATTFEFDAHCLGMFTGLLGGVSTVTVECVGGIVGKLGNGDVGNTKFPALMHALVTKFGNALKESEGAKDKLLEISARGKMKGFLVKTIVQKLNKL